MTGQDKISVVVIDNTQSMASRGRIDKYIICYDSLLTNEDD